MRKIVVLHFLIVFLIFSTNANAQSTIEWSKDRKLNWSDFKATPNKEVLGYALTVYKIEIIPSDVMVDSNDNVKNYESLTVVAKFYSDHSWVYEKNDYLLLHEQLHFDIAGLYAFKMQVEFEKLKQQKNANFYSYYEVYQELWAECRKTQDAYDKETSHGQLVDKNNNWINKIAAELRNFE